MQHYEFWHKSIFYTETGAWMVTDRGERTVVAVKYEEWADPQGNNRAGGPYSIVEHVFDRYAMEGCSPYPYHEEHRVDDFGPKGCGATCSACCDHCQFADLDFDDKNCFVGGRCSLDERPIDPGKFCSQFRCVDYKPEEERE